MSHPLLPATRGRRPWGLRPWSATVGASGHAMHHRLLAVCLVLSARTNVRTYWSGLSVRGPPRGRCTFLASDGCFGTGSAELLIGQRLR